MSQRTESRTAEYLRKAYELAEKGRGRTNPNPMVGAVLVKNDRIVGEGYHQRAGSPHAEIEAIRRAGGKAKKASLYVSLEPCSHFGRTPPCVKAIVEAGVEHVIIGTKDPNPEVNGKGIAELERHGLKVTTCDEPPVPESRQNEVYFKYIKTGKPFLLLKVAMSLDAKIAAHVGARTSLTSSAAQQEVHKLRDEYQAVMVGVGTVLVDDPLLNCRLEGNDVEQPARIVVDSKGRTPLNSRLIATHKISPVIVATTEEMPGERRLELEKRGVEVIRCLQNEDGRVDLMDLLGKLGKREISSVMVEGGAIMNEEIVLKRLADKLVLFVSPRFIGGPGSLSLTQCERDLSVDFKFSGCRLVGDDVVVEAYPVA